MVTRNHRPVCHEAKQVMANIRQREEAAYTMLAMLRVLQQQLAAGLTRSTQRELSETIKELLHDLPRL